MAILTGYAGPTAPAIYEDRPETRSYYAARKAFIVPGRGGPLKQSTAVTVAVFIVGMDGTAKLGLVDADFTTKSLSKVGAAPAAVTPTITEVGGGWYSFPFTTAHTDTLGVLTISFSSAKFETQGWSWEVTNATVDNIATAVASIQADTDDIQTRLPAALVSGRMSSYVGAADAAVVPTPTTIAALQTDTDDIQTRLPAALVSGRMSSYVGAADATVVPTPATIAAIQADTDNLQTRVPAALVGGRMDSYVGAADATVVPTAAGIADAVLEERVSDHTGVSGSLAAIVNTTNNNVAALPSSSTIVNAILNAARSGHVIVGSIGEAIALSAALLQGNFYMDNVDNSDPNGQTAARIRVFSDGTAAAAATPGGTGEGEFATFVVATTYTGLGKVSDHRVVQQ
jgi:hypothetical protein